MLERPKPAAEVGSTLHAASLPSITRSKSSSYREEPPLPAAMALPIQKKRRNQPDISGEQQHSYKSFAISQADRRLTKNISRGALAVERGNIAVRPDEGARDNSTGPRVPTILGRFVWNGIQTGFNGH